MICGKRIFERHTNKIQLRSRTRYRLYFLYHRRRMGIYRQFDNDNFVSYFVYQACENGRKTKEQICKDIWLWSCEHYVLPLLCKHRHDHRIASRNRHSASVYQLRRLVFVGFHSFAVHFHKAGRLPIGADISS